MKVQSINVNKKVIKFTARNLIGLLDASERQTMSVNQYAESIKRQILDGFIKAKSF